MAKNKQVMCKAKALVFIKYDKTSYKPGDEFKVRIEDAKELNENGYAEVEMLEQQQNDDENPEGNVTGEEGE